MTRAEVICALSELAKRLHEIRSDCGNYVSVDTLSSVYKNYDGCVVNLDGQIFDIAFAGENVEIVEYDDMYSKNIMAFGVMFRAAYRGQYNADAEM